MENKETEIYVARTSSVVEIPKYESALSAGMDVKSVGRYILFPQQKVTINTGLVVAIQSLSSLDVRPRSGLSLKTPFEVTNSPGTIDADYRGEIGIILKNSSLPSYETWVNNSYIKLWNYLDENKMKNGYLSNNDIKILQDKFGEIYTLDKKDNTPGIYVINPGDRIAQILMGDQKRIKWITENFLTDEQKKQMANNFSVDEINAAEEEIRERQLKLVKTMGHNRGGGFGSTGIK